GILLQTAKASQARSTYGAVFRLIPRFMRDPLYLLVARNRYKWFGKREECWVPTPEQAKRVL
ncbi:MAG: hypothetical protein AAFQ27_14925, partial [Pseudomonadota bacterium]